jgi:hypothetical protein
MNNTSEASSTDNVDIADSVSALIMPSDEVVIVFTVLVIRIDSQEPNKSITTFKFCNKTKLY